MPLGEHCDHYEVMACFSQGKCSSSNRSVIFVVGLGFRGAMERDDPGDGAQAQPLAGSGSGSSFVEVVESLAACLAQDEEPSAAASVGESYVFVDATGF